MMKKPVLLTIRGTQRIDGEEETIEVLTCGELIRREKTYWISYDESETTGFAGHRTTLHIEPGRVTMRRTGLHSSQLIIEKGLRHQCSYGTEAGPLNIGIMGSFIRSTLSDDGGEVDFAYSMDVNTALQAEQRVTISVRNDTAARS